MVDLWGNPLTDHFLRIPWPLIGALVIGLPILIGLLTALCTRSRLPMVARMS